MALTKDEIKRKAKELKRRSLTCAHTFPDGRRCGLLAGVNQKTCVRHGAKPGYAGLLGERNTLSSIYLAFHLADDRLDLSGELALQRTMLSAILLKIQDKDLVKLSEGALYAVTEFINSVTREITKTVKAIADVENMNRNSVHVNDIKMVVDGLIEILFESGIEPKTLGVIAEKLDKLTLPDKLTMELENVEGTEMVG